MSKITIDTALPTEDLAEAICSVIKAAAKDNPEFHAVFGMTGYDEAAEQLSDHTIAFLHGKASVVGYILAQVFESHPTPLLSAAAFISMTSKTEPTIN